MSDDERTAWDRRYRERGRSATDPAAFVCDAVGRFAAVPGRALDLAGGAGRHAVWLATIGWEVCLVDISPRALELAAEAALAAGVSIMTVAADLDATPPPAGPWELAVVHHYLNRSLLDGIARVLVPDGVLVFAQPTVENLRSNDRPGPEHSLRLGEAVTLMDGLVIEWAFEGWTPEGRHEAQVVARRPGWTAKSSRVRALRPLPAGRVRRTITT